MRRVFQRIVLHGGLTALALGLIGVLFVQLASLWLAGASSARPVPGGDDNEPVFGLLQYRLPVLMAVWGFAFVTIGECVRFMWRGDLPTDTPAAKPTPPDEAELLLEELLRQADAAMARDQKPGGGTQTPEVTGRTG